MIKIIIISLKKYLIWIFLTAIYSFSMYLYVKYIVIYSRIPNLNFRQDLMKQTNLNLSIEINQTNTDIFNLKIIVQDLSLRLNFINQKIGRLNYNLTNNGDLWVNSSEHMTDYHFANATSLFVLLKKASF